MISKFIYDNDQQEACFEHSNYNCEICGHYECKYNPENEGELNDGRRS